LARKRQALRAFFLSKTKNGERRAANAWSPEIPVTYVNLSHAILWILHDVGSSNSSDAGLAMKVHTDSIIDDLVEIAMSGRTTREQFLFRQSLDNLVRLAKAEQMLDIRASVAKLTGAQSATGPASTAEIDEL
jgi:hypothetical protein